MSRYISIGGYILLTHTFQSFYFLHIFDLSAHLQNKTYKWTHKWYFEKKKNTGRINVYQRTHCADNNISAYSKYHRSFSPQNKKTQHCMTARPNSCVMHLFKLPKVIWALFELYLYLYTLYFILELAVYIYNVGWIGMR